MKLKRSPERDSFWQPDVYDLVTLDVRRYSPAEALEFYEQIWAADPRQRIVFLTGPPKYVSRTWPGEVIVDDTSHGQWVETGQALPGCCLRLSRGNLRWGMF